MREEKWMHKYKCQICVIDRFITVRKTSMRVKERKCLTLRSRLERNTFLHINYGNDLVICRAMLWAVQMKDKKICNIRTKLSIIARIWTLKLYTWCGLLKWINHLGCENFFAAQFLNDKILKNIWGTKKNDIIFII